MVRVEIVPWDVREALAGSLTAGESMETAARGAEDGAADVQGSFGSASEAAAAFSEFWAARDMLGRRAAAIVAHNAAQVSGAAREFIAMDTGISSRAEQTVATGGAARVSDTLELT